MIGYIILGAAGLYALTKMQGNPDQDKLDSLFQTVGDIYGIPWQALKAFYSVESNYGNADFVKTSTPNNGRYGIMGTSSFDFINAAGKIGKNFTLKDAWNPEVSVEVCAFVNRMNDQKAEDGKFWAQIRTAMESGKAMSAEMDVRLSRIVGSYLIGYDNLNNSATMKDWKDYYTKWKSAFNSIIARQGYGLPSSVKTAAK